MATPAGHELVEFWMGHTGGVERHYQSKDPEWHRQQYAEKAMPHLRLETATPTETEKVIQELRAQLMDRNGEVQQLREQLQSFQQDIEYIRQMRSELEFLKEGGVTVVYTKDKISKEDVKKLIKESKKRRKE